MSDEERPNPLGALQGDCGFDRRNPPGWLT